MSVNKYDIRAVINAMGLSGRPVMMHSSLKSFGRVDGGADAVIDAFLNEGCTLLVPTFTYYYNVRPVIHYRQNGTDYANQPIADRHLVFRSSSNDINDRGMGAIPIALINRPERRRGYHQLNSFAALGPVADELVKGQNPQDVYAPIRRLMELGGYILLAGVDLRRMTAIHYAEQLAGRNLFIEWAHGEDGRPMEVRVGSCSDGFNNLEPALEGIERRAMAGESPWRIMDAQAAVDACAEAIRARQGITACENPGCLRCRDSVLGGPDGQLL